MSAKPTHQIVAVSVALFSALFAVALTASGSRESNLLNDEEIEAIFVGVPYPARPSSDQQDGSEFCPLEKFIQLNSDGSGTTFLQERPLIWQSCRRRFPADALAQQAPDSSDGFSFSSSEFYRLKSAVSELSGPLNFVTFEKVVSVLPDGCPDVEDSQDLEAIGIMIVRSDDTAVSYTIPSQQVTAMRQGKCAQNSMIERQLVQTFLQNLPSN